MMFVEAFDTVVVGASNLRGGCCSFVPVLGGMCAIPYESNKRK